jgi:hypothetical protein
MAAKKLNWLNRTVLLGGYLILTLDESEDKLIRKKLNCDYEVQTTPGFCTTLQSGDELTHVVGLRFYIGKHRNLLAGILSHEATHAAQQLFSVMGEKEPGREIAAYVQQNIFVRLLDELDRRAVYEDDILVRLKQ